MLKTRIIPVLLLKNGGIYKGKRFKDHKYIGDPINIVRIFNDKEVDELIILDIEATSRGGDIAFDLLQDIVSEAFMPLSYGGGITSIEDAEKLFSLGIEKIVLNTWAVLKPGLVRELSSIFGSQSIVCSIDIKKNLLGCNVYIRSGRTKVRKNYMDLVNELEASGAGEIMVTDIKREGTRRGYNLSLIRDIASKVKIPVIASGGAASLNDFRLAKDAGAHACAAGSMFVFHGSLDGVLISYPKYDELRTILGE